MKLMLCTMALLVLAATPALANKAPVEAKLKERKINYEIDKDGDFKIVYNYEKDKRTQLLYISGGTETLDGMQIREILSPAARLKEDNINGDAAIELMKHSATRKLGSWEIRGNTVYYVIKFPDSISAVDMETMMDVAASAADDKEKEFSGNKDDL
jgi:hypothetical protein